MICYNCNSQIPDNAQICNNCGATFYNNNQPQLGFGYTQPPQNFGYKQPAYFNQPTYIVPKKNHGIIMGIVIGVLYLLLIGLLALLISRNSYEDKKEDFIPMLEMCEGDFLAQFSNYDGRYVFESATSLGMTFTKEELEAMSGSEFDMAIVVRGSVCTLDAEAMGYDAATAKIEFDGNQVTIIDGMDKIVGTYDAENQSITFTASGVDMTFVKED